MSKIKTASGLALLALAATLGTASAEPWASYETAFPTFPCQDGWVGCIQDGHVLEPDLQPDGTGMPNPADARIGWFDLQATSNFNPFPTLSKYTGEQPRRKSDKPEPVTTSGDGVASAGTNDGSQGSQGSDGTNDGSAQNGGTNDGGSEGSEGNDAVVAVQPVVSDEGREAEAEAQRRRLEEAEARKKAEQAEEERQRAEQEEQARRKAADDKAAAAQRALKLAQEAQGEAEKAKLMEDARRAKEAEELARKQADEAAKMRTQREAEAKQREAEEAKAKAASERAEADRKKQEEADRKAAEKARQEDEARQKAAAADAQRAAEEARRKVEEAAAKDAAAREQRAKELAEQAKAAATDAEKARIQKEAALAAEASKKAEEDAKKNADAAAEKARMEEQKKAKEAEEQRKAKEAEDKAAADKAKAGTVEQTSAAVVAQEGCDDLVTLETVAILGKLDDATGKCLEGKLAATSKMTEKSKISRALMINAFAAGRTNDWADLMKRHLTEIEQSDPELCYKYALHLSKMGPASAYGVIKWANVALENRTIWTGSTYTARVYSLYKIRATSAEKIWVDLENKHAASPSEESSQATKTARDRTKEYAREWYEYAKVAGKPTEKALDLCMSSAGTKDYCEAG